LREFFTGAWPSG